MTIGGVRKHVLPASDYIFGAEGPKPKSFFAVQVTKLFLGYILFDFLWIAVQPSTLPSLQPLILGHHFITFLLLTFPYRYPAFGHFTCWDGITEINTFFLIARRQTKNFHREFHW